MQSCSCYISNIFLVDRVVIMFLYENLDIVLLVLKFSCSSHIIKIEETYVELFWNQMLL